MTEGASEKVCTRAAPKIMPPILLRWPTTSEVDAGVMAVETEPSNKYSITFCCCVTDGSRGKSYKMASDMEVQVKQRCVTDFLPCGKKCTH